MEYQSYNFGHDEWDYSTQMLRKWQWAKIPQLCWRMPTSFGPAPGPRQDFLGHLRSEEESTFITSSIRFRTSRTLLQNLLPTASFSFTSPGTVAEASWSASTLENLDWLGGSGYMHCGLYLHGVQYKKQNGDILQGTFLVTLFENLADPIITGREELGFPKLFCDIRKTSGDGKHNVQLGVGGLHLES
jgi:hypothetical protein